MSQNSIPSRRPNPLSTFSALDVSNDGYIRLPFTKLRAIPIFHLASGLEENYPTIILGGAIETEIVGYTEWISNTNPPITIGWDWQMGVVNHGVLLRRISEPRSNIMLQDLIQKDLGPRKTIMQLEELIDTLDWRSTVQSQIETRYDKFKS
jgi:hypothetical protein